MPDFDVLNNYEFDEDILVDSLDFLVQGAEVEETINYDKKGEISSRRTRIKRSPDSVLKGLAAADIITGGRIGLVRSGMLAGKSHKMLKTKKVVIPHDEIDSRVISNNRPLPGSYDSFDEE